jgi:hypothetical protein
VADDAVRAACGQEHPLRPVDARCGGVPALRDGNRALDVLVRCLLAGEGRLDGRGEQECGRGCCDELLHWVHLVALGWVEVEVRRGGGRSCGREICPVLGA